MHLILRNTNDHKRLERFANAAQSTGFYNLVKIFIMMMKENVNENENVLLFLFLFFFSTQLVDLNGH